ncbi:MAG: hypothetical protein EXR20_07380 [Bacteroidetes bacterium]|nr:hypothetical protein [Bacteroidota bacterium]
MNDKTIELIEFINFLYVDGVLSEKEVNSIQAKAKALDIGPEETEVIIEQVTSDPESVKNMVLQFKSWSVNTVSPVAKSGKKRVSQELKLSLHTDKILFKENESFKKLNTLSYDEIFLRTIQKIFKSSIGEKVKQLKEIEKEISDLKKESKAGSEISSALEKRKIERKAVFGIWTGVLYAFTLLWTYFSLIGLKSDWVSIVVGIGFSILFVVLINMVFTPLIDGYINKEISLLDDTVDDLSENDNEIQSRLKRLIKIKTAVTESLNEQKNFQELVKSKRNSLEIIPFYEAGCNEIIRQTEISDGDMQKIIMNCLFIRDAIKEESDELNDYTKNESKSGLPSPSVFRSIERKISKINVYMTLLNGYCYSIQSLSERTQFEHFLSENLINLSKKDKLQLQGMKKMIGQLSNINESVSGLSREVMMLKDSISDIDDTLSMLEYSVDDMRYSVDDIKDDIADSKNTNVN